MYRRVSEVQRVIARRARRVFAQCGTVAIAERARPENVAVAGDSEGPAATASAAWLFEPRRTNLSETRAPGDERQFALVARRADPAAPCLPVATALHSANALATDHARWRWPAGRVAWHGGQAAAACQSRGWVRAAASQRHGMRIAGRVRQGRVGPRSLSSRRGFDCLLH